MASSPRAWRDALPTARFAFAVASRQCDELIRCLQPSAESEAQRKAMMGHIAAILGAHPALQGVECMETGSFPLKTCVTQPARAEALSPFPGCAGPHPRVAPHPTPSSPGTSPMATST